MLILVPTDKTERHRSDISPREHHSSGAREEVFGLGEGMGGITKKSKLYSPNNTDLFLQAMLCIKLRP